MTSLKDARRLVREKLNQYTPLTPYRYGVLGDGRGHATSNIYVNSASNMLWARETAQSNRFFPVLNRNAVTPTFGLPIVIGYKNDEPRQEQILGVHVGGLGTLALSGTALLGPHHHQHEWGGGDEVFSDGLQLKPGLLAPTNPVSMSVQVLRFPYFWDRWREFPTTTTMLLNEFRPSAGQAIYLLVALDPQTQSLVYRPGLTFAPSISTFTGTDDFTKIPAPAGNEFPIGYIGMDSSTTILNWSSFHDNIGDARLHVGYPLVNVLDRLRQLEGLSGNEPSIATTGAGASTVSDLDRTLGGLTNVNVTGVSDGQALVFSQATNKWLPGNAAAAGGLALDATGPTESGAASVVGVSASAAHGDHIHRGIASLSSIGGIVFGNVLLGSGDGINANATAGGIVVTNTHKYIQGTGLSISNLGSSYTFTQTGAATALYDATPANVSGSGISGTSASAARGDHEHRGVATLSTSGNAPSYGGIMLIPGTGVSVSQSSGSITITATGVGAANISGSGTKRQVVIFSDGSTIIGDAGLVYSGSTLTPQNVVIVGGTTVSPITLDILQADITAPISNGPVIRATGGFVQNASALIESFVFTPNHIVYATDSIPSTLVATEFKNPLYRATKNGAIVGDAATVYISGAPSAGSGISFNRAHALSVNGMVTLGSQVYIGRGLNIGNAANATTGQVRQEANSQEWNGINLAAGTFGGTVVVGTGTGASLAYWTNVNTVAAATLSAGTGMSVSQSGATITLVATGSVTGDIAWLARADGRLTLASGSPVDIIGIGSAASLYYTPHIGNQIGLINASTASILSFSEVSLNLNALSPNSNYDIFGYANTGTLVLEANRWTNDTTRNAGLNRVSGTLVRSLDSTRRYLGTIRITGSSGWTADNTSQRYVWNNYNRVSRSLSVIDTTDTWDYAVTAWRAANNSNANKVEYVAGVSDDVVMAVARGMAQVSTGIAGAVGIGIDSSTANAAQLLNEVAGTNLANTFRLVVNADYLGYPGLGYHYVHWIEYRRAGTVTFEGDGGVVDEQSGLLAMVNA